MTSTSQANLLLQTAIEINDMSSFHPRLEQGAEIYEGMADNPVANLSAQYMYHSGLGRIAVNGFDTLGTFIMNVATYFLSTFTAIIVAGIVKKYSLSDYDYFVAFIIAAVVCMSIVMMVMTFKKCLTEKMGGSMDVIEKTKFDELRTNLLSNGLTAMKQKGG